jgi:hypothetical protein
LLTLAAASFSFPNHHSGRAPSEDSPQRKGTPSGVPKRSLPKALPLCRRPERSPKGEATDLLLLEGGAYIDRTTTTGASSPHSENKFHPKPSKTSPKARPSKIKILPDTQNPKSKPKPNRMKALHAFGQGRGTPLL